MNMTHDEIMKLEAGRELDALVAEKVMGWKWFTGAAGERLLRPEGVFNYGVVIGDKIVYLAGLLHYSTDIAAAWQVVEWFMERGDIFLEYWSDREWFVSNKPDVVRRDVDTIIARCNGKNTGNPSLPLAICRAALLAVMDNRP